MFYVLQNESTAARRRCPILLTDSATGTTGQSGVAISTIYPYVSINGGAFAGGAGTVAEVNFGQYYYEFDASEITTLGLAGIHITAPGCRDYDAIVQVAAFNMYSVAGAGLTAGDVWSYGGGRSITGGIADTVTTVTTVTNPVSVSTTSMASIASTVWNTDVSAYTDPSAGYDVHNGAAGAGISAYDVWNYTLSDLNTAETDLVQIYSWSSAIDTKTTDIYSDTQNIITNTNNIPLQVWGDDLAAGPNAPYAAGTAGTILYDLSLGGSGISAADVWNYVLSDTNTAEADLTFIRTTVDNTEATVNTIDSRTQTIESQTNNIPGQVWSDDLGSGGNSPYGAGTAGTILYDLSLGGSGLTAGDVWDFNITGFGSTGSAAVYATQTNFTVGNIETYVASQTPQDVWTYAGIEGRTITGGLADTVTTLTNPANITTASMTGIAGTVWSAASRTITGGTATTVTNAVDITTSSMSGVAGSVWNSLVASYSTNGTFGLNILRADTANKVGDVTLRSAGGINMVDADIHRIDNDVDAATNLKNILTGVGSTITGNITGNLSGSVGSVTSDVNVSEVSMSGIANTVWGTDVSGYASPSAGYDLSNATAGGGITAGDIWTYATRTITGGIADTVTSVTNGVTVTTNNDKSGYSLSGTQTFNLTGNITGNVSGSVGSVTNAVTFDSAQYAAIASSVWNAPTRTLTSGGSGISAADVWNYGTRTITGGIADTVTTLTDRSGFAITGGTITTVSDKTGYSLSASQTFNVTGNITGNVSGSVGSVAGNVSGSVASVVGNVGGNVAGSVASVSGNVGGNVVGSVASVTNPVTFVNSQYAAIASSVWNAGTRTLTSGGSGISAYDVWNFVLSDANTAEVDLVQAASGAGLTAGDVWTYGSRTITGGIADTVTTITNRSGFAITGGTVDTVTNGVTVTTNNDKTGYALSGAGVSAVQSGLSTLTQAQVGTEVDSSLADVGLTSTVTGRIDATVSSRLASASYTAPPTTAAIWSYTPRTLTSGAGATAGDVWTYPTRSLTSGAGITVNAATNIINGPYFVKSNVDSQDGTLDVIRGMVQDIQLTVTDAFQNPFDTTALGLLVNFYDQAGTLTTSYATTELYGPAGLVQFTLDTAVTANEGRYNLILSAAGSGNTIKFGPLQTLVRPF